MHAPMAGDRIATSALGQAYRNYESSSSEMDGDHFVNGALVPSFEALNPFAKIHRPNDKRWQPVADLPHSKESLALCAAINQVLKKVHEEISPAELEVRANTPEYKVLEGDWVAHNANAKNQFALITPLKTVARLPKNLIIESQNATSAPTNLNTIAMSGYLRKRGETNKSYKKRYMELVGPVLTYYKKKPEKNGIPLNREDKKAYARGSIDLDRVSSLKPVDSQSKSDKFGIHLVTSSRTWVIAADSEEEYMKWLKALCNEVKFEAVHVTYRRMFQLQEVSSKAITDVRMVIATGDTVGEIVEHIFNCYKQALDAAPLRAYDPSQFCLKITGYRDYMIDRFRVMNEYMHVRECLLTKKTIRLSLIHESVIKEAAERSLSIRTDNFGAASNAITMQLAEVWDDVERGSVANFTMVGDDFDNYSSSGGYRQSSMQNLLGSGRINQPLSIRIRRVLNIPRTVCVAKRSSEELLIEHRPLSNSSVIVHAELYDGCQLLENGSVMTADVRLKAQKNDLLFAEWDEPLWFKFGTNICDLPRSTRLVLTVYGVRRTIGAGQSQLPEGGQEKMLVAGVNVFEIDGSLVQGLQYVQMLNNLHDCRVGPVPHIVHPESSLIQLDFFNFQTPIKFTWNISNDEPPEVIMKRFQRRSTLQGRSAMLHKEGWLHKLGFSKWSKWRKRWFVVDQRTCTMSYAEDEHQPRKMIPLKNCSVIVADEMNEKYTTCPVNKGTRKERQTYCFKVRPMNSSRDYIISAETKQEREEWMLAIHTVSKSDGSELNGSNEFNSNSSSGSMFKARSTNSVLSIEEGNEDAENCDDNNSAERDGKNLLRGIAEENNRRLSGTAPSESGSSTTANSMLADLRRVILMDPLYRLSPYQKEVMWAHREEFVDIPEALPRILSCVHWTDKMEVEMALELLPKWSSPEHTAAYIELLDGEFANEGVRQFAVSKINSMADTTLSYFLPQLVQALKFENHHVSALATFLIERAIKNPNQIGFDLFWHMKVEAHNPQYRERYGTLLNTYLDVCSHRMRAILKLQDKLFAADGMFERICVSVKAKKKEGSEEMKKAMREGLEALNEILPASFQLPIDPRVEVGKIIVSKCRVMDSAKKPLWLVFENAEEGGDPVTVIFKAGDDVRQDCLTLQLIRLMDEMWRDEGLDLAMEPYKCVATSPMTGILQVVPNSVTTAQIHRRVGVLGAFKDPSFSEWIAANNPDKRSHRNAIDLFGRSCAGYCVATCVLGIGDRHNDNIMISCSGRYFHIDFGHFLGHFKYQLGVKRERTPFVFTREMAHVLGGTDSKEFRQFVETSCNAYNIVRKHMHLLVALMLLMIPAGMPELNGRDDLNHLVTALAPELSEQQARESFVHAINFCLDSKFKRIDNTIHLLAHLFE